MVMVGVVVGVVVVGVLDWVVVMVLVVEWWWWWWWWC